MYVRDELGDFSECAYSLLLSYRSSHPSRGGDQQQLVTASLRYTPLLPFIGEIYIACIQCFINFASVTLLDSVWDQEP